MTIIAGVICGVALLAAPWPPQRPLRLALLLLRRGALRGPDLVEPDRPILALLALAIGLTTLGHQVGASVDAQRAGL